MKNKTELRAEFREKRKYLNLSEISRCITEKIRALNDYQTAQNVMLFYPMKYEINLLDLLRDNKNFYFPKVESENLLVCPNSGKFIKSDMKIFEPDTMPVNPSVLDLIIVPALAADLKKYRLGYGGGFYDRLLKQNPTINTITPVYKEFVLENLPHDDFDVPVKNIVTN